MDDPKYFEEKRELLYSLKEDTQVNFKNSTSKFKTEILTP